MAQRPPPSPPLSPRMAGEGGANYVVVIHYEALKILFVMSMWKQVNTFLYENSAAIEDCVFQNMYVFFWSINFPRSILSHVGTKLIGLQTKRSQMAGKDCQWLGHFQRKELCLWQFDQNIIPQLIYTELFEIFSIVLALCLWQL